MFPKVPPTESIGYTTDLLYTACHAPTNISRVFILVLLEMVSKNVIMLTHSGFVKQIDSVNVGSFVGSVVANIFISKDHFELGSCIKFYGRSMDGVMRAL